MGLGDIDDSNGDENGDTEEDKQLSDEEQVSVQRAWEVVMSHNSELEDMSRELSLLRSKVAELEDRIQELENK